LVGRFLEMHYTGTIDKSSATGVKGKQFDSSVGRGSFKFELGGGLVIKGWDEGLVGLCKGAKVSLVVEPEKGYDVQPESEIPPGATLHFDIEVVGISDTGSSKPVPTNLFAMVDVDPKDGQLSQEEIFSHFKKVCPIRYYLILSSFSMLPVP
jgi:FKBP-type peptidyl-prolyl cis-trans isomerase 2